MEAHALDGLDHTEAFGATAVARALGARAVAHDDGSRPRMHDVWLAYEDGRRAALEITSHSGPGIRQRDALIAADNHQWQAPGNGTWTINVPTPGVIPELRAKFQSIIRWCEEHGLTSTAYLDEFSVQLPVDVRWAVRSGCHFWGYFLPEAGDHEAIVYVLPAATGGAVDERLEGLSEALSAVLAESNQRDHIAKVIDSGAAETHLFIAFGEGGLPFEQAAGLHGRVEAIDCEPPLLPAGLAGLWFVGSFSHTLVGVVDARWQLHQLRDGEDAA
ncbi:hypothetical protein [Nocardioides montaniterrae]